MENILLYLIDHFPDLLDVNLTASIVILFVLCVRQFLKHAPKIFSYALWGIVLLRLLVPVSIESPVSFVPERTEFSSMVEVNEVLPEITFETPRDRAENEQRRENIPPGQPFTQVSRSLDAQTYLTFLWLFGMAVMLLRSLLSYGKLRRKLKVAVPLGRGICLADDIDTPFVMGIFRPVIYLPGTLDPAERKYIIAHERHHIRRGDHIFKAMGYLALTIHWFNPFVWAAFALAGRDMEMSCDEAVIRKYGEDIRSEYAASLLNLATGHRLFAGNPLAFGEGDPTGRVRNLAKWKKPALWVILLCAAVCLVLAACLLTDPETKLPFMDDYHEVISAELIDLREEQTVRRTFSEAEMDELGYRLRDLRRIEEYTEENTIIPIVILNVDIQNIGILSIDCVSWEEDQALLRWNGSTYWIRDEAFLTYLRSAWNQDYTVPALEAPRQQPDWGVSIRPDRVSRTGATALFVYSGSVPGEEGAELTYGDFLSLDRLVDGNWIPCDELAGYDYYVGDSSYPVVDGYGMVHEWPNRFGELDDGHYRLGKQVTLVRQDGSAESRMVYGEFAIPDSILTGPIPLEDLPEKYSSEQAMLDGCLVCPNGIARENLEQFREFADACSRGEAGFFRVMYYYYGDDPYYMAYDIRYDGNKYTVNSMESGDGRISTFEFTYLKHFTGPKEREEYPYDAYEYFVLTRDDSITWQEIFEGKHEGGYMPIFLNHIYYPKQPQLPENPARATLELNGEPLASTTDFDRLEKIWILFQDGEFLGYEPKTHSIGLGLNLILESGSGESLTIELDPDSDICRIGGEFVFYGAYDEPDYIEKLWYYLDLPQWPEQVYAAYPNALRP